MDRNIQPAKTFKGSVTLPGDKSLSHRGLILGALAEGKTHLTGLSHGEDVQSTARCFEALGVPIDRDKGSVTVNGVGLFGFQKPSGPLDCGNSGSTMRMLMGILAGQSFRATLTGDASLSRRPMDRVSDPLKKMGAEIALTEQRFAPLTIEGKALRGIEYSLPVASAQVKSALLLAGLLAERTTTLTGKIHSRDHTERLLPYFGAVLTRSPEKIRISGKQKLHGVSFDIPGDPSSAAFWLAGACIVKGGQIAIDRLLLNPTRTGFQRVLTRMGAKLSEKVVSFEPERVGNVEISYSGLKGVTVTADEVASLIDEVPMLAVLATYAEGVTEVRGAEELRVKESDRIEAVATNLRRMGAEIETFPDGFRLRGPQKLRGCPIDSFHDHRIAMAFAIGALGASGETQILNCESVAISYPEFFQTLQRLTSG